MSGAAEGAARLEELEDDAAPGPEALDPGAGPEASGSQLSLRAVITGMVIGSVLSLCNIYAGLKIGWLFNMSVTAVLLSYGFWGASTKLFGTRRWGLLENNLSQTGASAAASIASAGLVAPIPALAILTGQELGWPALAMWAFVVSVLGIVVALGLRKQMLIVDRLPFPAGIATAETLKQMYAKGQEALGRVKMLLAAGVGAAALKIAQEWLRIGAVGFPGRLAASQGGALGAAGLGSVSLKNLTFALDPSLLMVGMGAIVGLRAGLSLLLGAVVAWGIVGPQILEAGWARPDLAAPDGSWFGTMVEWLLWPGVALMVSSSLTSVAFSWRSFAALLRPTAGPKRQGASLEGAAADVPRSWLLFGFAGALVLAVVCQILFFGIGAGTAILAVALTSVLAVVAARVSGETGITPIGAMGQMTQLTYGLVAPGNAAANLMAANVTGGAASQCADLLHDLKTGHIIGASPRAQATSQFFGVLAGALVGTAAYLMLIPDPRGQLLTAEWPAPAVATWKAVAELFMRGLDSMPPGATLAMAIAGATGVALIVLERVLPSRMRHYVPSASSIGLAFVIPALSSISMCIGAVLAAAGAKFAPRFSDRYAIVIAAGLVAGESLAGVAHAIFGMLTG